MCQMAVSQTQAGFGALFLKWADFHPQNCFFLISVFSSLSSSTSPGALRLAATF